MTNKEKPLKLAENASEADFAQFCAYASGADLARFCAYASDADLTRICAYASDADLTRICAYASEADFARLCTYASGADLARLCTYASGAAFARLCTYASDADLARICAHISKANLARLCAYASKTDLARIRAHARKTDLARLKKIQDDTPVLSNPYTAILAAISKKGCKLEMRRWHACKTTHCLAGWTVVLTGQAGKELEDLVGTPTAAKLILSKARPKAPLPDFYASNAAAVAFIEARAREEIKS